MRVAVTGATGVIGRSAVRALVASGHDVVGLARTPDQAALLGSWGARAAVTGIFDHDGLVRMFDGCDAVCNLASHTPVGYGALWPGAWRQHDRLRTEGVRRVVDAARAAGVRRLVQGSVSYLYADHGDEWITEQSPVEINRATEPASVGESLVQDYACHSRTGVVLRFGTIAGGDDLSRWPLGSAQPGYRVGIRRAAGWAHVVHTDDLGPAVLAALNAPGGTYNVGAEPVLRSDLAQAHADAVGGAAGELMGPLLRRLAGTRVEPLTRSLRVSSQQFTAQTGWTPRRAGFDGSWFDVADAESESEAAR